MTGLADAEVDSALSTATGGTFFEVEALKATPPHLWPPAKRIGSTTFLGHYPDYGGLGDAAAVRYFDIPEKRWKGMTGRQQWEANKKFLDRLIARRDRVVLVTHISQVRNPSFLHEEIGHLLSRGYVLSDDGFELLPPDSGAAGQR